MTPKELAEFFATFKAKQERKKKALERKKEKQQDNIKKQQEKALRRLEKQLYDQQRAMCVYHNKHICRSFADDEVYSSREELMEAEKRNEGEIRWDVWDKLVNETKKIWLDKNLQMLRGRLRWQSTT